MKNPLLFSLFCLALVLFACKNETPKTSEDNTVYERVEKMPHYPGCDGMTGNELRGCASKKMFKHIQDNIKYPETAKAEEKAGRAAVSFVVDKDGSITDVELVKDPGFGMGEEAVRVIKTFPKWIPGEQKGEKVKVRYILPVTFKL